MPSSWSKLNLRHSQAVLLVLVRSKASSSELAANRLHFSRLREVQVQEEPQLCVGSSTSFFQILSLLGHGMGPKYHGKIKFGKEQKLHEGEKGR